MLVLRFGLDRGDPRTTAEIAQRLGLTAEAVRRLESRATARLRHPSRNCDLSALLAAG